MTYEEEGWQTRIAETLKSAGPGMKCVPDGPKRAGVWQFQYTNGTCIYGTVRLTPEWVLFGANFETVQRSVYVGGGLLRALHLNAWLPGMLKLCISPQGTLQLAAEIPQGEGHNAEKRLLETARGLGLVSKSLGAKPMVSQAAEDHQVNPAEFVRLFNLCEETGWPCHQRENGTVLVDLDGTDSMAQARLSPVPAGGAKVRSELAHWGPDPPDDVVEKALSLLLLRASQVARMVRMTVDQDASGWRACCEVRFSVLDPSPVELDRALGALAAGDSLVRKEVEALIGSSELATEYVRQFALGGDNGK